VTSVGRDLAPAASPWRRILVVYAILAVALFAFPGGIVDWLDERNAAGWLDAPLAIARGVDAASAAVGVKGVGQSLRKRFATIVGGDEG
jgi:hypothetical protein